MIKVCYEPKAVLSNVEIEEVLNQESKSNNDISCVEPSRHSNVVILIAFGNAGRDKGLSITVWIKRLKFL
jgi:hypothetical protein